MASLGSLTIDFIANTGPFDRKVKGATKTVNAFEAGLKKMGRESAAARHEAQKSSTTWGRFSSKLAVARDQLKGKFGFAGLSAGVRSLTGSMGGLLAKLGLLGGAAGIGGIVAFSVKAAADLETTKTAFEVMLGSATKADRVVGKLFDFSKKTPFQPEEVFRAGRRLVSTGIEEGELESKLKTLGDIASGSASRLGDIIDIYSKMRAKGKASLEELNRFSERGINIIGELAKTMGKTRTEIYQMVTDGTIRLPQLEAAIKSMTSQGGIFFDGMAKQSKTLNGLWSTLVGNFKAGGAEIGSSIVQSTNLKGVLDSLNKSLETFDWESFGMAAGSAFRVILIGAQVAVKGLGALSQAKHGIQSGLLSLTEQLLINQVDAPGNKTRTSDIAAIRDTFAAKRADLDSSKLISDKVFADLNRTLDAAVEASKHVRRPTGAFYDASIQGGQSLSGALSPAAAKMPLNTLGAMVASLNSALTPAIESLAVEVSKATPLTSPAGKPPEPVRINFEGVEGLLNDILSAIRGQAKIEVARSS